MSTRRTSMMTDSSSAMLPPARSPGMANPVSPSLGAVARDNYTTSTPGLQRHNLPLSPRSELPRYNSLPETPRSLISSHMPPLPTAPYTNSLMTTSYPSPADRLGSGDSPPFNAQENYCDIICDGQAIVPTIEAKIEKGFFWSGDRVWTCYRRNYFAVNAHYTLHPWVANGRLYLNQGANKPQELIQSMAVSLAAAVDGTGGKSIELIQHTPKRDKGPQLAMKKELLAPTPPGKSHDHTSSYAMNNFHQASQVTGPSLPLQNETEPSQQYSPASHANSNFQHAFERIQFKSATANNGKRRAQQQYYHLIVELWANIQRQGESEPRWVKVAARSSHPVVVRGRSPSHYHNEGPHNANASRGTGSGGMGGPGHHGLGSNGSGAYGSYSNGLSGRGASGMGGSVYRGTTYSLDPSPVGSHSVSSASSLSGGPVEGLVGDQHMGDDEDSKMIESHNDYQYYPAPIYETIPAKMEGVGLPLPERRIKEEYPGPASMGSGWQVGGCGRFQGMETSRGYYPDVHAHTGY
ncbi:p53-like transcription factor [Massarina eburnea CBS 473.64]|uniref:p53-like transcription factor n=1 Tax=Massarina eburnea CBS 473.64 TaxID=1395130 RepID=A0A6A6RQH9_9PLEO|nr:p53-like transcription factor [Massarina eburnea CBS 473.64]